MPSPNPSLSWGRADRLLVITSPRGPVWQSEQRTAWVESSRLILDLESPCQQLWLGQVAGWDNWGLFPFGEPNTWLYRFAWGHIPASASAV